MKRLAKLLTIVFIFGIFTITSSAEGTTDEVISDFENILPDEFSGITENTDELIERVSPHALLSELISVLSGKRGEIFSFLLLLLGVTVLLSLASSVSGKLSDICECAVGIVSSVLIFGRISSVFGSVDKSLTEITEFFSALIPILTGITLSGGGTAAASVQAAGMNITLSLLGGAGTSLMLSAVGLGLALALLSSLGDENISSLSKSLGSFFKWLLGIPTTLIMGTLSLQTVVSSAADSAAMRAAKYAASGMIPMVGATVSGALSTLAAGLSYAKGIVGAGAVAVMLSIVLSPLAVLLLYRLALSLALSFAGFLGTPSAVRILTAYRTSLDTLIAVYSLSSVVCVFEVILFIKSGVALL